MEEIGRPWPRHPVKRVVLTGSESVGKTTLAQQLAAHFGALVVPEFSRAFAAAHDGVVRLEDVPTIATEHGAAEDDALAAATARGDRVLVLDTDLISTVVYSTHYFGACPEVVRETANARRADYYLVLDIDVPWVADGVRDRGDRRDEVHALFVQALLALRLPFALIRGTWPERFRRATVEIDRLLSTI